MNTQVKAPSLLNADITAIHNDLTFSKREVYLWVRLTPVHYEFRTDEERTNIASMTNLALANLLINDEKELEAQLLITSTEFDVEEWRTKLLKAQSKDSPSHLFPGFIEQMGQRIKQLKFRQKVPLLGIKIGDRSEASPKKSAFKIPFMSDIIDILTGEVDEHVSDSELEFWEERARITRLSLYDSQMGAEEATSTDIVYAIRKSVFPNMKSPTREELSVTKSTKWGLGELRTLLDADIENTNPKYLKITQVIDGEEQTGYRATLCASKFPDVYKFPRQEPWIHSLSQLGFSVDFSSRFNIIPSRKVRKQITHKIKSFEDQINNMTSAGGETTIEVETNLQIGKYLEFKLSNDETPWLYGRHRFTVEAESVSQLNERVQAVIDHYKRLGIMVTWSTGDQLNLLMEQLPNDHVRLSSYYQRHELGMIGVGTPAATGGVGDLVERINGTEKGWLGPYIGYTNSRITEPVFLSIHSSIDKGRPPGCIITGMPGSGKTFAGLTMTYNMVLGGAQVVFIDPKMDAIRLKQLPGMEDAVDVDLTQSPSGMLDPFQMGETESEKLDLAYQTVALLVGGEKKLERASAELSKRLKKVVKDRYPTMNKLTAVLKDSDDRDAQALGEELDLISSLPYSRLCFSTASRDNPVQHLQFNSRLTIITMMGLDLPNSELSTGNYTKQNHLAVAIMFLITSFTRRLMRKPKELQKAIVIDEAWAVTSNSGGAKMVIETARLGRSLNTALVLISQNAKDFNKEIDSVNNSVATRLCFRAGTDDEAKEVLKFLGLQQTDGNIKSVKNLNEGECLMQDSSKIQRVTRVKIDAWNSRNTHAYNTNPNAKS